MDIYGFISTNPNVIWLLVVIGSVAVIGAVDFCKNWLRKRTVKWAVLFTSLGIALVLSPLVPAWISTVVIMWLLILSVSTIARNAVVDGLPSLVARFMGAMKPPENKTEEKK
jgi:hypothetical protein